MKIVDIRQYDNAKPHLLKHTYRYTLRDMSTCEVVLTTDLTSDKSPVFVIHDHLVKQYKEYVYPAFEWDFREILFS